MNLLHSKMFVSNELSKGFQIKSAVIKNVILKEKIPLFQQEKFRRKLKRNSVLLLDVFLLRVFAHLPP